MWWLSVVFRMHEGSTEQSKELQAMLIADTRLLGKYSVFDHKKFSVYNLPFKLKSSLIMKYCQSTNFSLQRHTKNVPSPQGLYTFLHSYSSFNCISWNVFFNVTWPPPPSHNGGWGEKGGRRTNKSWKFVKKKKMQYLSRTMYAHIWYDFRFLPTQWGRQVDSLI